VWRTDGILARSSAFAALQGCPSKASNSESESCKRDLGPITRHSVLDRSKRFANDGQAKQANWTFDANQDRKPGQNGALATIQEVDHASDLRKRV